MESVQTPHTVREFDQELRLARGLLLQMGAHAERQVADALQCLETGSRALADQVLRHEAVINLLERAIDDLVGRIIARRQPAAGDLRLLTALIKSTTDLERIGDEAKKIALRARKLSSGERLPLLRGGEIARMGRLALGLLRASLSSLERLELEHTVQVVRQDEEVNDAFRAILRELISYMIEDPRTISDCLDMTLVAKGLERVGDHATNIAEYVVYAVAGKDVRHTRFGRAERESDPAR